MRKLLILFLIVSAFIINGCTVYKAVMDERSIGTMVDDGKIRAAILNKIRKDEKVSLLDFTVHSLRGEVFIIGKYKTQVSAQRAIDIAKNVQGVKNVTTYIISENEPDPCGTTVNLEKAAKIKARVVKDTKISSTNVRYKVINCKAVIWGILGSNGEIQRTINHAEQIVGKGMVVNLLRVK